MELGPQLSKLYATLRDQQKANHEDGLRGTPHMLMTELASQSQLTHFGFFSMAELASQSPRAVSKRIREVMNFEFELSQDEGKQQSCHTRRCAHACALH